MALQTSGTITWAQIRTEFGGSNPVQINQYYRGGARVPNTTVNNGVPTSGTIRANNFYGASATAPTTPLTISFTPASLYLTRPQLTSGTLTGTIVISGGGGSGSYSVVSHSHAGDATVTRNGFTITVTGTGRNRLMLGDITVIISDGSTTKTGYVSYELAFGTVA